MNRSYTEEQVEIVKSKWKSGLSLKMIAISVHRTRGSVAGLISRTFGFNARSKPKPIESVVAHVFLKPMPVLKYDHKPESQNKDLTTLENVKDGQCRYIINNIPFGKDKELCGEKVIYGSYCDNHANICFNRTK
jgi:hypothetical protein